MYYSTTTWLSIAALLLAAGALVLAGIAFAKTTKFKDETENLLRRVIGLESAINHSKSQINRGKTYSNQVQGAINQAAAPPAFGSTHGQQSAIVSNSAQPSQRAAQSANPATMISPQPLATPPRLIPPQKAHAPATPKTYYLAIGRDKAWKMAEFKSKPENYTQFVAYVVGGKAEYSLYEPNVKGHLLSRPTDYRSEFLQIEGSAGSRTYKEISPGRATLEGSIWRLQQPLTIELT